MKVTDSERLILVMLSNICKKLDIRDEIDPDFVIKAICNDQTWALPWEYQGLFDGESGSETPPIVKEVLDILGMWDSIERAYEHLPAPEKEKLKKVTKWGKEVAFGGFDGNNEAKHYGTAKFIIDDFGRFPDFKGRDLNTHYPELESYRRMLVAFERLGGASLDRMLNSVELQEILNSRMFS